MEGKRWFIPFYSLPAHEKHYRPWLARGFVCFLLHLSCANERQKRVEVDERLVAVGGGHCELWVEIYSNPRLNWHDLGLVRIFSITIAFGELGNMKTKAEGFDFLTRRLTVG